MGTHAIHHVTAVTANIGSNLEFYTQVLGLRLVKRSVNQDDVSAYHLFYADGVGSPGTDLTFFDWPTIGPNAPGSGMISRTTFRVPDESLDWWESRLQVAGTNPIRSDGSLLFADPEGQALELADHLRLPALSKPWTALVPEPYAIRGILGVDLASARADSMRRMLTEVLDYEESEPGVFTVDGESSFARVRLIESGSPRGRVGAGGVHHVAFRVADDEDLFRIQDKVESMGLRTSGLIDRYYFHSLYFREPGGILFEAATDGPGFASDEPVESLGGRLALPPFLEPQRARIEAGLKPLPV